ncbi:probable chitinase 2 [Hetaerina americana]|uniref:probable chitinase 2 n=1 Tax=Hetaerina americana TaxID=62018 RepID=UPI003A7F2F9C
MVPKVLPEDQKAARVKISRDLLNHCEKSTGNGGYGSSERIVCYFNSTNTLAPEDIDISLCTHLVYKAAVLDPTNNEVVPMRRMYDLGENGGKGMYKRTVELKILKPELRVLLAIGTWDEGSIKFSSMASTGIGRRRFARSAVDFLRQHGFDGMSLDWEYPGRQGGGPDDKRNYDLLTFELRIELDRHGLLLSGLLPQTRYWLEGYDMESVKRNFHYICLNTYNYWGPWWDYTGIAAALKDVEASVNLYLAKKVPSDMIVLGIPAYAQTANLAYAFKNQRPQIIVGPGTEGPRSRTRGRLGYDEARFIVREKLGGAMIMSIDSDDFRGIGSNGTFPLTRTLHRILHSREEEE